MKSKTLHGIRMKSNQVSNSLPKTLKPSDHTYVSSLVKRPSLPQRTVRTLPTNVAPSLWPVKSILLSREESVWQLTIQRIFFAFTNGVLSSPLIYVEPLMKDNPPIGNLLIVTSSFVKRHRKWRLVYQTWSKPNAERILKGML